MLICVNVAKVCLRYLRINLQGTMIPVPAHPEAVIEPVNKIKNPAKAGTPIINF